ncbi:unnamed protein product [Sphagnum balticum]
MLEGNTRLFQNHLNQHCEAIMDLLVEFGTIVLVTLIFLNNRLDISKLLLLRKTAPTLLLDFSNVFWQLLDIALVLPRLSELDVVVASCLAEENLQLASARPAISYPVRLAYIDRLNSFQTVQSIAAGMGIPGYAPTNIYNYVCFGYWTSSKGPQDIAEVWAEPQLYYNTTSPFGKTKE